MRWPTIEANASSHSLGHLDRSRAVETQVVHRAQPLQEQVLKPLLDVVVVPRACGLQVANIPHRIKVTTVRDDVVNAISLSGHAYSEAAYTQRMLKPEATREPIPACAIATLSEAGSGLLHGVVVGHTVCVLLDVLKPFVATY